MNTIKKMSTEKRAAIAIIVVSLVMGFQNISVGLVALIMQSYPELDSNTVRQVLTIPSLVGMIMSFSTGPLSMKINKKHMTMTACFLALAGCMIYGFVGANGPFVALLIGAGCLGLCQGCARTLTSSMIGDFMPPEKRASYVARSTAMMSGGGAVLSSLSGVIAAGNGGADWPKAYFVVGFLAIPILIVFTALMPLHPDEKDNLSAVVKDEVEQDNEKGKLSFKTILVLVLNAVFGISCSAYLFNYSEYIIITTGMGTSVHTGTINAAYLIVGLIVGFTYPVFLKIFKRYISPVGHGLFAIGLLCMMHANNIYVVYLCAVLISFGFNLANPFTTSYLMCITPKKLVPIAMSLLIGSLQLGMFFSVQILSFLSGLLGGGIMNTLTVGVIGGVICCVVSFFAYSLDPRSQAVVGTAVKAE